MWWGLNYLSKCYLSSSYCFGVMMFWWFGGTGWFTKWMNQWQRCLSFSTGITSRLPQGGYVEYTSRVSHLWQEKRVCFDWYCLLPHILSQRRHVLFVFSIWILCVTRIQLSLQTRKFTAIQFRFHILSFPLFSVAHQESNKDASLKGFFCGCNPKHQIEARDTVTVRKRQSIGVAGATTDRKQM